MSQHTEMIQTSRAHATPARLSILAAIVLASATRAHALQPDVIVTLKIGPGHTITAGSPATLTAAVSRYGTPITTGLVTFCNANVECTGPGLLGVAPATRSGNATLKLVLGAGDYTLQAHFNGLRGGWASDSAPRKLSVTGNSSYKSATTIRSSRNTKDCTLTATVAAFGRVPSTGTVSFADMSSGNHVLATASLDPATLKHALLRPTGSPLAVGAGTSSAKTGDFNGDGIPDLAIGGRNSVSIYLGKGDGTFRAPTMNFTRGISASIAVGDFNGDGFQDLVVVDRGSNSISILLGKGDGTFQSQVAYGTGRSPSSVEIADVNWDGVQDLVVANSADNDVSVFLGNGDGSFQSPTSYPTGRGPTKATIGDFNGDGYPDIATANTKDNDVTVLLGNGDGTFATAQAVATSAEPESLETGDLNGDGIADLVVGNHIGNSISILLGNGDGTFQSKVSYSTGAAPGQMVLGDFNGDSLPDVAIANTSDSTISLLFGRGDGTFLQQVVYSAGRWPIAVTAADLNGDGLLDLVALNLTSTGGGGASVLLSGHSETATSRHVNLSGKKKYNVFASYSGDDQRAASQSNAIPLCGLGQACESR